MEKLTVEEFDSDAIQGTEIAPNSLTIEQIECGRIGRVSVEKVAWLTISSNSRSGE